jgi:Carboxypeptidase regulatory-like domain
MTKHYSSLLVVLLLNLAFGALLFAQQADRVVITGLVTDPSGAGIPDAAVTVTDEATHVSTNILTTADGNYSTPPLIVGTYTVKVEKQSFKTFLRSGIAISGGTIYRQDAALEVGATAQTIEVKGESRMINIEQGDVSYTLNQKYYQDLPVVMGTDMRLAEVLLQVQPGYVPTMPSGDTIFRGSGFNSRVNGGQTMATENFIDGAAFGTAYNHNQTQENSPPYDAIQEMKVIDATYSAQYGRTSGGFVTYTTKSGTSQLHGSLYYYMGNTALDSRGEFFAKRVKLLNNDPGFTLGGPVVIPKVYNGRNKTFFFTNLDDAHIRQGLLAGYTNTVPTLPMRSGDFSSLLDTSSQIGADALGRPVYQGEIFNPASTRLVNGIPVRDGYGFDPVTGLATSSANVIPAGDPLRSQVAANLTNLIPSPDRAGFPFNSAGINNGDPTKQLDPITWLVRMDHEFTPTLKMSHTLFLDSRPSIRNCGDVGGCNTQFDPTTEPQKNTSYIGDGYYQRISNQFYHQQFDWIVRPNVYNHTTVSFDRWLNVEYSLSTGAGWNQLLGITGIPYETGGPPAVNFSGVVPYSHLGIGYQKGSQTANRWQFLDDISWVKGRHTIKAGFEFRWHQFPFTGIGVDRMGTYSFNQAETGGFDAQGNSLAGAGDAFASMLLGQVDNSNFQIPTNVTWYEAYLSPWINDEFKVNSRLTLTLGLRFDYQKARREAHDRYSNFDPTAPNPGAGGIPGAMVFAGTGPGHTGQRTFEDPKKDAFGPRFGFAYRLTDKSVIRGGYGIYYGGVNYSQFAADADIGFATNPTAPNVTNGLSPAFFWDNGFPQNLITHPPTIDPAVANGTSPVAVAKDDLTLPRYQNWSLTYEAQLKANLSLNISYIGNHATRLPAAASAGLGLAANMNDPKILALGAGVLESDINSPLAQAAGIKSPYAGFTGDVAQALRPWPQYQLIGYRNNPIAVSFYDALQAVLEKRFSHGFQGRIGFTWSKLINTGAEFALAQTGQVDQNPLNYQRGERGLSTDDVPHLLFLGYTYELPFGPGRKFANTSRPLGKLIGGWSISGIQRYQAGRPLIISMNNDLSGFLFNTQKRPDKVGPGVIANRSGFDPNGGNAYLLSTGWADPGALKFGNASRTDPHVRWFPEYNEDISLYKDTIIHERAKLRYEALFGNIFNRHFYCTPDTNWSDGSFGSVSAQCNTPRRIQFALDLSF